MNKRCKAARQKISGLPPYQQNEIQRLTNEFREFMRVSHPPFQMGEYLCKLQSEWNQEKVGLPFSDFIFSLVGYPEFHGKGWTILNYYKRFYQIYQDYEPRSKVLAVGPQYASSLSYLIRHGALQSRLKPCSKPSDLLKSREEALEHAITGKMNGEELITWIRSGKTQGQEHLLLQNQGEIIKVLLSQKEGLKKQVGLELIGDELSTGIVGRVDLAGLLGTLLVMIEVESEAKYDDVGQLLGFVGELTIKRVNDQCTIYRAGNKARDKMSKPIRISCTGVTGWLVAKSFAESAFYAAYGQQITFWRIGLDGSLLVSLDMRTATKSEFEKFQIS